MLLPVGSFGDGRRKEACVRVRESEREIAVGVLLGGFSQLIL